MSFHLYQINELYSSADGTLQFIEMSVGGANGEGFWAGHAISVAPAGAVPAFTATGPYAGPLYNWNGTHNFVFPSDLPSEATANTKVLIATQAFADLGIVKPDFIIPAGFLFTTGGAVNYSGVDVLNYTALPTDGVTSVNRDGSTAPASPTDFAGVTAVISAPPGGGGNGGGGNGGHSGDTSPEVHSGGTVGEVHSGGSGNDVLQGGAGNETIDGGAGEDKVVFAGPMSSFQISATGGQVLVTGPNGTDTLQNIERVQFADKSIAFDTSGDAGEAYRLYQAAFNRSPDLGGLGYQMKALDDGLPLATVAQNFIDSPEFSATYGALNTTAFVVQMYANVLHRQPDPGGLDFYTHNLDSGAMSRAAVLVGFSESPENQAALIGVIQSAMTYTV